MRNKKLIYIFIIFLIILFFFSFKEINAYTFTSNVNGNTYTVPDFSTIPNYSYLYKARIEKYGYIINYDGSTYTMIFGNADNAVFYTNGSSNLPSTIYSYGKIVILTAKSSSTSWDTLDLYTIPSAGASTGRLTNVVEYGAIIYKNYTKDEVLYDPSAITSFPYIMNKESDLAKGNEDIIIMPEQFSNSDDIRFVIQKITETSTDTGIYEEYINCFETIILNSSSDYYVQVGDTGAGFYYKIPWSFIEEYLEEGTKYNFVLSYSANNEDFQVDKIVKYVGLSGTDIYNSISSDIKNTTNTIVATINQSNENLQNSIEQQTEVQEEQLETSKGIWASIKEVISYINPFSENFFVYKLIDLLIDALKSLFIPGEGFLDTYFSELLNWFSDRLGFLSYPLELILDVLNRILTINFEEPIINIPDIYEPSTNIKIISERSFNFNSLLENNTLKTVHNIYLILVDAVIVFGLVNLLKNKLEEVFTK